MSGDYVVGYCKPPKNHQWQPGQSGNPRGGSRTMKEKKKPRPFLDVLIAELYETIAPNVDGKKEKMLAAAALAKLMVRDALTGSPRDRREFYKLLKGAGGFELLNLWVDGTNYRDDRLTPTEEKMLEEIHSQFAFVETLPDGGEGWDTGHYDLNEIAGPSGERTWEIIPGPAYKSKKSEEDAMAGHSQMEEPVSLGGPIKQAGHKPDPETGEDDPGKDEDDDGWANDPFASVKLDGEDEGGPKESGATSGH